MKIGKVRGQASILRLFSQYTRQKKRGQLFLYVTTTNSNKTVKCNLVIFYSKRSIFGVHQHYENAAQPLGPNTTSVHQAEPVLLLYLAEWKCILCCIHCNIRMDQVEENNCGLQVCRIADLDNRKHWVKFSGPSWITP